MPANIEETPPNLGLLMDVPVSLTVELGSCKLPMKEVLQLISGSVVQLEKVAEEPVELLVNGKLMARGKIQPIPIYVDSPLAIDATTVFATHPEVFDQTEDLVQRVQDLFHFLLVNYTRDASESKALNWVRLEGL